jgi:hypothetical protein
LAPAGIRNGAVALLSGLISALLALSAETGSPVGLLMVGLAPIPLFGAGLTLGALTCLAAGLAGTVAVTLGAGSIEGACFLGAAALPTAILVRAALRRRRAVEGGRTVEDAPVWRDGGALLLWLAGLGVAGVLGVVLYSAVFQGGLVAVIADRFGLAPAAAAMLARIAPGLLAAPWTAVIAANAVVAEWLAVKAGRAIRPPVDMRRLRLPLWVGPILMVAGLAGAFLRHGTIGIVCLNSAIVLIVPFAFLGLALIHALAARRPGGTVWLIGAYALLLGSPAVLGWQAALTLALMLAGLGSVDQLLDLRDIRGLRSGMRRK